MENTWASGAIELLRHADSHINLDSAFDRRIAFISIDNAVETMIRTFLSLPKNKSGVQVSRKHLEEAENSFPKLLALLWLHVGQRLTGIDDSDIEHYHRIRNKLYHDGTGLSVDEQYLLAYRQIAAIILQNLFGVKPIEPRPAPTLEHLIVLWNSLEENFKRRLAEAGIDRGHTFFWEAAIKEGIITGNDAALLSELRMIRNKQVHSLTIDRKQIEYAIELAEKLLNKIGQKG
jgi:hypothetical protein